MSEELLTENAYFSIQTLGSRRSIKMSIGEVDIGFLKFHFPGELSEKKAEGVRKYGVDPLRVAELNWIETYFGYKRRGYGTLLLKRFEQICVDLGASGVVLELRPSEISRNFYEKNGYLHLHDAERRMVKKL